MDIADIIEAATAAAEDAESRTRWNYDYAECKALYAIEAAFLQFASLLESKEVQ